MIPQAYLERHSQTDHVCKAPPYLKKQKYYKTILINNKDH